MRDALRLRDEKEILGVNLRWWVERVREREREKERERERERERVSGARECL